MNAEFDKIQVKMLLQEVMLFCLENRLRIKLRTLLVLLPGVFAIPISSNGFLRQTFDAGQQTNYGSHAPMP